MRHDIIEYAEISPVIGRTVTVTVDSVWRHVQRARGQPRVRRYLCGQPGPRPLRGADRGHHPGGPLAVHRVHQRPDGRRQLGKNTLLN